MSTKMSPRTDLYWKDGAEIRRLARELIKQTEHYERNGAGDESRFDLMEIYVLRLGRPVRRAMARHRRERGNHHDATDA